MTRSHKQRTSKNEKAASLIAVPTACDVIWEQFWPWRASQVARFDRGDTSAIDFATREQLAREPPADSARRPIPPEGPPPGSEPGSWR